METAYDRTDCLIYTYAQYCSPVTSSIDMDSPMTGQKIFHFEQSWCVDTRLKHGAAEVCVVATAECICKCVGIVVRLLFAPADGSAYSTFALPTPRECATLCVGEQAEAPRERAGGAVCRGAARGRRCAVGTACVGHWPGLHGREFQHVALPPHAACGGAGRYRPLRPASASRAAQLAVAQPFTVTLRTRRNDICIIQ